MKTIIFAWLLLLAAAAHAQVFKCPGPDGRTIYSDRACGASQQVVDPNALRANTLPTAPRATGARPRVEPAGPQAVVINEQRGRCPSELDIKNMETSAASMLLSREDKLMRQAHIDAAKDCRAGGSGKVDFSAVDAERRAKDARIAAGIAAGHANAHANAQKGVPPPTRDTLSQCVLGNCQGQSGAEYRPEPLQPGVFQRRDGATCTATPGGVPGAIECR